MFPDIASLLGVTVASTVLTTTVLDYFPHGAGGQRHVTDSHPWGVCGNERQLKGEGLFHICSLSGLLARCRGSRVGENCEGRGRDGATGWEKPQGGRNLNDVWSRTSLPERKWNAA